MAYEQKPNTGSLFKNDKEGVETRPDIQGSVLIDGVEYWVSGWTNPPADGKKWRLGLSFKKKESSQEAVEASKGAPDDFDDEIPF